MTDAAPKATQAVTIDSKEDLLTPSFLRFPGAGMIAADLHDRRSGVPLKS